MRERVSVMRKGNEQKERRKKQNIASVANSERHFRGKLSFALAHTQACDKDVYAIFSHWGGVSFLISMANNVNKRRKKKHFMWLLQSLSISGKSKKCSLKKQLH